MSGVIFGHALRSHRRPTLWWIAGIGLFIVINVATWPAVEGQAGYDDLLDDMPDAMLALFGIEPGLSLTSPTGYLIGQIFGFFLPLMFVMLTVTLGSRAIASSEEDHSLDLLLAHPVTRGRLLVERLAAVVAVVVVVGLASWVVLVTSSAAVGLDAGLLDPAIATAADVLFGIQSGALAVAVGAALGRRAPAVAIASGVAVGGFVLESLAEISSVAANLRWLSPFHYVNGNIPLLHGMRVLDVVVLVGLTVAATVIGTLFFDRRDLAS